MAFYDTKKALIATSCDHLITSFQPPLILATDYWCLCVLDKQSTKKWTAHDVELALWSFHFTKKLKPELLRASDRPTDSKKHDSESENSDVEPPLKKHKRS